MQYYNFHIGDYTTATVHLTTSEDLTYRRLLDYYYMKEEPIPTDIPWVSRRLRVGLEDAENVLKEFFKLTEKGWENDRCNADIKAFHEKVEKNRRNGKMGGRPRKNPKKTQRLTNANPTLTQSEPNVKPPSTHNPLPIEKDIYRKFDHLALTIEEFDRLVSEGYTKNQIDDVLDRVENFAGNKKYKSLVLTARNWLKKDSDNSKHGTGGLTPELEKYIDENY